MALTASSPPQEQPWLPGKQLRNQLAAAVRSINWTYAIFWSISSTHPGLLTWTDGFYNGEIKTRKIANNSGEMTADQLALQRSEQLRELYESLQPARGCDPRPVAALSPDELGDTEWYYVVCMTYAFRPGQGLPGRCLTSNQHVWLCNAHLADSKTFPRALLAKSATIQTVFCIPLMGGVLELGATDSITEDQELVSRVTTSFWELQFPAFTEEPCQCPSGNEVGDADDIDVFEDIAMETMIITGELEQGKDEILPNEIDDLYSLCEELHVQPLEDEDWNMQGPNLETPFSQKKVVLGNTNNVAGSVNTPVDGITSCFVAWTRGTASDEATVPVVREPQRMLKKVVAGGVWENSGGGGNATRSTQESGIKNHVMSERRRREKLNEMFLVLKSIVPTIHKVDKASILAETIAYLKELQQRVQELESISRPEHITTRRPSGASRMRGHNSKSPKRRKASPELISVSDNTEKEQEHHWVLSKDGTSNVTVTVTDREVLLEVHCQWEELLMARVFDAIKALQLDLLSVQASTPNGFMGLKIHAQSSSSATIVPRMISEAVRKAIGKS